MRNIREKIKPTLNKILSFFLFIAIAVSIITLVNAAAPNPGHTISEIGNVVQGDILYGSATDVISALAKSATVGSFLSNSGASNNPAWAIPLGYTIHVQALTASPADSVSNYFGNFPRTVGTSANISRIYIRKAGTIKIAELHNYSGTAGTAENWSLYIRLNNTTDTLVATVAAAASERIFSNTGLSIAVVAGDYIEMKTVNPAWVTNPLTSIWGGYIYIE